MICYKHYIFGVFFTKRDIDDTNKQVAIGFRIAWKERHFIDVYFYPKPHVHTCEW